MADEEVPGLVDLSKPTSGDVKQVDDVKAAPEDVLDEIKESEMVGVPVNIKTLADGTVIQAQVAAVDTVQDIKQFLFETADTSYFTSYDVYLNNEKLNEFQELSQVNLQPNCTFEMREAAYEERSGRLHVRRVRELVGMTFLDPTSSPSAFSYYTLPSESDAAPQRPRRQQQHHHQQQHHEQANSKVKLLSELKTVASAQLKDFFPPSLPPPTPCVQSVMFSSFNPPPSYRKLVGDLFYLEVKTLEGTTLFITAWDWGFFLNSSTPTVFNPFPNSKPASSYTLVGLLNLLSPMFRKGFKNLLTTPIDRHPLELMPVPYPVHSWIGRVRLHTVDLNRSEDSLVYANDNPDIRGSLRDWNEEFQSCKELPKKTIQERIQRDRVLSKINSEFVDAATRGSILIINKSIPPINPLETERSHVYIYNNIFFSFAVDHRDQYVDRGGDVTAYQMANNDLKGVKLYAGADVEGLYTLGTCIVDYRGFRVVGQSLIPGILTNEKVASPIYGSMDQGKTIVADPEFHKLVMEAGKPLRAGEHVVEDEKGASFTLGCAVDTKGIAGMDGRKYILDIIRPTPRDPNYKEPSDLMRILRPELITVYSEYQQMETLKAREIERVKAAKASQDGSSSQGHTGDDKETAEADAAAAKEALSLLKLNHNLLGDVKLGGSEEQRKTDEEVVAKIGKFMLEAMIPALVKDINEANITPVDGMTLTAAMHERGINVRYIGRIAKATTVSAVVTALFASEMIARAAKHIFNDHLKATENYDVAPAVAHFLNCFLGNSAKGGVGEVAAPSNSKSAKKKKGVTASGAATGTNPFALSRSALWKKITALVKTKFDFDLPTNFAVTTNHIAYLRAFCLKTGVTINSRDYHFQSETPFKQDDILDLFPLVKHADPRSADAQDLLEHSRNAMYQGKLELAVEAITESLMVVQQVSGPLHLDAAMCESNLAMILYSRGETAQAIAHQAQAVVIFERVLGMDHHDTVHAYGNLGLFCYQSKKVKEGLAYMSRALYLGSVCWGQLHPDLSTTFTTIAHMLQDLESNLLAVEYFKEAIKSVEALFGAKHVATADAYHNLALGYQKAGDFKEAMLQQKKNYNLLVELLGDGAVKTKESNLWLGQFTQLAVAKQIEIKKAEAALPLRKPLTQQPASTDQSAKNVPLSEVLRFINTPSAKGGKKITKISSSQPNGNETSTDNTEQPQSREDGEAARKKKNKKNKGKN